MTREEQFDFDGEPFDGPPTPQVAAAMKLLDGRGGARANIERAVVIIEYECNRQEFNNSEISKEAKRNLRSLISAYRRAQIAQKKVHGIWQHFYFKIEFEPLITRADELLKRKAGPPKRDATKAHVAVREAYDLLRRFGYPVAVTRGGKWHKLSAVLNGEDTDLFHHLRAYRDAGKTRTGS